MGNNSKIVIGDKISTRKKLSKEKFRKEQANYRLRKN